MSSSPILRLARRDTVRAYVAASSVPAEPSHVERAKQSTRDYSVLTHDESRARRSESAPRSTGSADQSPTLSLSVDERAYLRSLPPLSLGVDSSWAPFTYLDSSGEPSGIAMAYTTYLSKALDIDFDRRVYPDWLDISKAFARGQIDMIATTERETPASCWRYRDRTGGGLSARDSRAAG